MARPLAEEALSLSSKRSPRRRAQRAATLTQPHPQPHPHHPAHPSHKRRPCSSVPSPARKLHPHHPQHSQHPQRRQSWSPPRRRHSALSVSSLNSASSACTSAARQHKYSQVVRAAGSVGASPAAATSVRPAWGYTHSSRTHSTTSSVTQSSSVRSPPAQKRRAHSGMWFPDRVTDELPDTPPRRPRGYPKALPRGNGFPYLSRRHLCDSTSQYILQFGSSRSTVLCATTADLPSFYLRRSLISLHDRATLHYADVPLAHVFTEVLSARRATHVVDTHRRLLFLLRFAHINSHYRRDIRVFAGGDSRRHQLLIQYLSDSGGFVCTTREGKEAFRVLPTELKFSVLVAPGYDTALFSLLATLAADLWAL